MGKKKTVASDENIALDVEKQEEFNKNLEELNDEEIDYGTIYVGHLPRGFYEDEMKAYFSQFDVAKIAADAMNNYLMFDRLLKCQYVAEEDLHPAIWKGYNKKFVWADRTKKHKKLYNRTRTEDQLKKTADKLIKKDNTRRKKLLELGINYEFGGYEGAMKKKKVAKTPKTKTAKSKISKKTPKKELSEAAL
ncbi:MKI67 FHA domain-interacting nucleolar phosphoprotein-like [Clytia hemisphaerica]|uniref:MKI67 FHA domain-interacting nucleolar phosphoprotein-like n=1 Tax=Clytia hemisphaerica TaxID=252671 RepID=UPI0034D41B48